MSKKIKAHLQYIGHHRTATEHDYRITKIEGGIGVDVPNKKGDGFDRVRLGELLTEEQAVALGNKIDVVTTGKG